MNLTPNHQRTPRAPADRDAPDYVPCNYCQTPAERDRADQRRDGEWYHQWCPPADDEERDRP